MLLGLALLGALAAHVSVNTLNEYLDFRSGLDFATKRTPFSGGSGALVQSPELAGVVLAVGAASLSVTLIVGAFFVVRYGAAIVPIGATGLVLVIAYTGWINRHPLLCLVAPGTGFGILMVVGTQFVLVGRYLPLSWVVATVPFFLVNNLLLLNQYPDMRADASVGRNHFPIAYGISRSNLVYAMFAAAAAGSILVSVGLGYLPPWSLVALAPMPLALFALYGAVRHGEGIGRVPYYLAANVAVTILTPLLLGASLLAG